MKRGTRSAWGALAVTGLVVGALAGIAPSAGAQSEATTGPADCGAKVHRLLFWPEGHGVITSQGFPEYPVPHLEVYEGKGKTFTDDDAVGYAEPGVATVSAECEPAEDTTSPKEPKKLKTLSETALLTCKTKQSPVLGTNTAVPGGGAAFTLTIGSRRVAVVTLAPPGGEVTTEVVYNSKLCKRSDAPA